MPLETSSEDYALTVFDIQLLYLPSVNFLEAIQYNELSKEDTEKRFSLLKRTDLSLDFTKLIIKEPLPSSQLPEPSCEDTLTSDHTVMQGERSAFIQHAHEDDPTKPTSQTMTSTGTNTMIKVALSIANIDCRMTTKEVKEFKHFADKFMQYHRDLEHLVEDEIMKLRHEAQFRRSINTKTDSGDQQLLSARTSAREYANGKSFPSVVASSFPSIER